MSEAEFSHRYYILKQIRGWGCLCLKKRKLLCITWNISLLSLTGIHVVLSEIVIFFSRTPFTQAAIFKIKKFIWLQSESIIRSYNNSLSNSWLLKYSFSCLKVKKDRKIQHGFAVLDRTRKDIFAALSLVVSKLVVISLKLFDI